MISASVLLLALTIYHEAGNQPDICKRFVGETVLNRSINRKKTVNQVIFQKNQYVWVKLLKKSSIMGDYQKILKKTDPLTKKSIKTSIILAKKILSKGYKPMYQGEFFQNNNIKIPKWYKNPIYCQDLIFDGSNHKE